MRSKLITVVAGVASVLLVAQAATADQVQEQLRLMEQRMAEMEDRLQATSDELRSARTTVSEQQALLTDAGLVEDEQSDFRSAVSDFVEMVDISGVVAASYNYRFLDSDDDVSAGGNNGLFRHPDANTFALDQVWLVIDKTPTDESRGGFHFEPYAGKTTVAQNTNGPLSDPDEFGLQLYTGYVSYLAPIGNGMQVDAGLLATPLGAEVLQTNQNFNITTGRVFGLQPVTHVGIQASTALTDELTFTAGVVNDVYNETNLDVSNGKAGYAQVSFGSDMFGLNVGAIVGTNSGLACNKSGGGTFDADDACNTSVFDVVLSADPSDQLSMWVNFDWARNFGEDTPDGDAFGLAGAGRFAITDATGFSTRVEYIRQDGSFNAGNGSAAQLGEIVTLTGTVDHELTPGVKVRAEARWDRQLDNGPGLFANGNNGPDNGFPLTGGTPTSSRDDQVVGLAELFFEF